MKGKIDLALHPVDDLFTTDDIRAENKLERLMNLPIKLISDFPDHPYKVKDDESMAELVESIKTRGLIQPVLVRVKEDGNYEMVSGHRRKHACEIAGITTIPARVQELSHDEAVLSMVDSNLQREEILPSEKAFAYRMRLDSMNRQGMRKDLTSTPVVSKLRTNEELADVVGESREQIRRYIRLTELIVPLLDMVDEKKIALRPAVEISYLTKSEQAMLCDAIEYCDATPSHAQTIKMRKFSEEGKLNESVIDSIMEEEKPNQHTPSQFKDERIRRLIPQNVPRERESDYVVQALEFYNRHREMQREER
ncbi:MAG: ParB/RepB/Spo0J family partition protein [Lentisphaerae bacterium]|nr:ParB/RepB/Spo0J family partition protein [Lentisphaerota bacterium]